MSKSFRLYSRSILYSGILAFNPHKIPANRLDAAEQIFVRRL